MKELVLEFKDSIIDNELIIPYVDELGLSPLLDSYLKLKSINLRHRMHLIVNTLTVLMQERDQQPKQVIKFHCYYYLIEEAQALSELSRLINLESLDLTTYLHLNWIQNEILLQCDKNKRMSAHMSCAEYFKERTDIWQTFCQFKDLRELIFRYSKYDFLNSVPNTETLIHLKEITIECLQINTKFFINITKMAPNLEGLELKSRFELTNGKLKQISQLKQLTNIRLYIFNTEKKNPEAND